MVIVEYMSDLFIEVFLREHSSGLVTFKIHVLKVLMYGVAEKINWWETLRIGQNQNEKWDYSSLNPKGREFKIKRDSCTMYAETGCLNYTAGHRCKRKRLKGEMPSLFSPFSWQFCPWRSKGGGGKAQSFRPFADKSQERNFRTHHPHHLPNASNPSIMGSNAFLSLETHIYTCVQDHIDS